MTPILNPEPGRFICRGLGARVNAETLADFNRDRGLKAVVLGADTAFMFTQDHPWVMNRQDEIASANIIIDVIP